MLSFSFLAEQQEYNDFYIFNPESRVFTKYSREKIYYPVDKPYVGFPKTESEQINCLSSATLGIGSAEMQAGRNQQQDGLVFGLSNLGGLNETVTRVITTQGSSDSGGATVACAAISRNGSILDTQHLGDARVVVIVRIKNPTTGGIQYISAVVTEDHELNLERIKNRFVPEDFDSKDSGDHIEIIAKTNRGGLRIYKAEIVDHKSERGVVLVGGGTNCGGVVGDNFITPEEDKILRVPDIRHINLQDFAEELIIQKGLSSLEWEVDQIEVVVGCDGLFDLPTKDSMGVDFKTKSYYNPDGTMDFDLEEYKPKTTFHLSELKKQFDEITSSGAAAAGGDIPKTFANFLRKTLADQDHSSEDKDKILRDNISIISCDTSKLKDCEETVFMAVCDGHGNNGDVIANDLAARLFAETNLTIPDDLTVDQGRGVFGAHIAPYLRNHRVLNSMVIFDDIYHNMLSLYNNPAINPKPNTHHYRFSFTDETTRGTVTITLSDPRCIELKEEDKTQILSAEITYPDESFATFSNIDFFDIGDERIATLNKIAQKLKEKKDEIIKTAKNPAANKPNPFGTTGIFKRLERRELFSISTSTSPVDSSINPPEETPGIMEDFFGSGFSSITVHSADEEDGGSESPPIMGLSPISYLKPYSSGRSFTPKP